MASNDPDLASNLYEESLSIMRDLGDRHGLGAILLGMGMSADLRGDSEEAERLLIEAQLHLREGGGGQGLSWPISNAMIKTSTQALLSEAEQRYQHSLDIPPNDWTRMVLADRDLWLSRDT